MSDCTNHIANLRTAIHTEDFQPGQAMTAAQELDFTLQAAAQALDVLCKESDDANPLVDGIPQLVAFCITSVSAVSVAYFLKGYSQPAQQQMLSMVYQMNLDLAEIVERIREDERAYPEVEAEFELFAEAVAMLIQRLQGQSCMFPPTGPFVKGLIDVMEAIKSTLANYLEIADAEDPEGKEAMFRTLVGQNGMIPNVLRTLRTRC